MSYLFQHIRGTDEYYYAGEQDTANMVWKQAQMFTPYMAFADKGAAIDAATVTTEEITYVRQSKDVMVADVDKTMGKVQRVYLPQPDLQPIKFGGYGAFSPRLLGL